MWSISDLKEKGKGAFKGNYWRYVVVSIILAAIIGVESSSSSSTSDTSASDLINGLSEDQILAVFAVVSAAAIIGIIISLLIKIFIKNPIMVGAYRFFIQGSNGEQPNLKVLLSGYKDGHFGNIFLTMLLEDIFVTLWSCLLIVPGIIKMRYSYRLVPYIIAENPDMKPTEVITKSRQMMNGHKWNAFLLDLSFIGWIILAICTCGLVGIFYTDPYMRATDAELYKTLKG